MVASSVINHNLCLSEFLHKQPAMSIAPITDNRVIIRGLFQFTAQSEGCPVISDSYQIEIVIPEKYPEMVPDVRETGNRIPGQAAHHVNPNRNLCLSSPLRILSAIKMNQSIGLFVEKFLIPFLYGASYKEANGEYPFGELSHGETGLIEDYIDLFKLKNAQQVVQALILLSMKKREANKLPCPCGCKTRYGKCSYKQYLDEFRQVASRNWYKTHLVEIKDEVQKQQNNS